MHKLYELDIIKMKMFVLQKMPESEKITQHGRGKYCPSYI